MSTEDDVFLTEYNRKKPANAKISEDNFEQIFWTFEEASEDQSPFAAVDQTIIPFESMRMPLKQHVDEKLHVAAKDLYEFWKQRRIANDNHPLQPSLKFETHQDNDDGDPYVCFRRREIRQTRKTRARDVQSTDKLKKLRKELEEGRNIVKLVLNRELAKRELLKVDKDIFESRAELKSVKIKAGIKADDDELLINQKVCTVQLLTVIADTDNQQPQKRKPSEFSGFSRPPGTQLRLPGRPDGRPLDADLVLLSDLQAQKENMLQSEIAEKSKQHEIWNSGFEDLTREPLSPVSQVAQTGFRSARAQQLMTPPSSVTSDSFDQLSPAQEKPEPSFFRYSSPPEEDEPHGQPAYRRRMGRNNRLWIDRRGMQPVTKRQCLEEDDTLSEIVADRYKYDDDDDDEQPVYEMDPYDTQAIRFRATIPFPAHLIPQRVRQESVQQARANGPSPTNNRSIAAVPQLAPT